MSQFEFQILTTAEHEEWLGDELMQLGAAAITNQDAGNQPFYEPKPGEYHQWNETHLIALFEDDSLLTVILAFLNEQQAQGKLIRFDLKQVEDINWVAHTQRQFKPQLFGKRLWICPSWETPPRPEAVNIILDPGCAFGTGTHPTTALCLEWLDQHIQGGESVIDYGCGSGILAIAAIKLGARHVIAIDHDPEALQVTRENADNNHLLSNQLAVMLPDDFQPQQVNLVIANIIAGPLITLAPLFATLVQSGGRLVLSGILDTQIAEIKQVYDLHFNQLHFTHQNEWVRMEAYKP